MMIQQIVPANSQEVNSLFLNKFTELVHTKRLKSLSNAVIGAMASYSLQPSKVGDGLAEAKGLLPKHARKQVDRLASNTGIDVDMFQDELCKILIGNRSRIYVSMDWTVFAKDKQMTLTIRLVTTHGRATPLLWKTVSVIGLKGTKNTYVFMLLEKLRKLVSSSCQVVVLADREFGTLNNMQKIKEELDFDYILRIKRNFTVENKHGIKKLAQEWLEPGKQVCINNAKLTTKQYKVAKVVICKEPGMKDMWCLVCSISDIATQTILTLYGKRWSTECSYRDEKDIYFGMGLKKARIKKTQRREVLLLISAIVIIFLTLLGAACEAAGFDKYIKANTVQRRTHSLLSQGRLVLKLLNNMRKEWKTKIYMYFLEHCNCMKFISDDVFVV
jgi:hypothetical protein